jgi:hypothetical protein
MANAPFGFLGYYSRDIFMARSRELALASCMVWGLVCDGSADV